MSQNNIRDFIERIKDLNWHEMIQETELEIKSRPKVCDYLDSLQRFERFIRYHNFPNRILQHEARLFFSVLKGLVERGDCSPSSLEIERQIERPPH